jgi:hypothetical protein
VENPGGLLCVAVTSTSTLMRFAETAAGAVTGRSNSLGLPGWCRNGPTIVKKLTVRTSSRRRAVT